MPDYGAMSIDLSKYLAAKNMMIFAFEKLFGNVSSERYS